MIRITFLLLFGLSSIQTFAVQTNKYPLNQIKTVQSVWDCFQGPFRSYQTWVDWLSTNKPNFSLERFPFTERTFNNYQASLNCYHFTYKVGNVAVDGFIIYPKKYDHALPAIIYNRGGNTSYGRNTFGRMMFRHMPLAAQNYVIIGSDYRGADNRLRADEFVADGTVDEFGGIDVNDVTALIPIIEALPFADETRIGVLGGSRGGMQSFLLAKAYPHIKAMAVVAGLTDAFSFRDRDEKAKFLLSKLIPDYTHNEEAALKARSAIYWADKLPKAPVLLLHAKDDERVSYDNATKMAAQLEKHGIPQKLISFETGGHNLRGHQEERELLILDWFEAHLR